MKRRIFGFQRRVWWPKWTPDSSSSLMPTSAAIGTAPLCVSLDCGFPPASGAQPGSCRAGSAVRVTRWGRRTNELLRIAGEFAQVRSYTCVWCIAGRPSFPLPPAVRPATIVCRVLHPLAQQFAGVADAYDRGRPGYPAEAVTIAAREFELHARDRVMDLGAGTGKLTATLVAAGLDVVAVEPLAEMRARLPAVEVVAATAEDLPFADGSLAAAFSADAFHWFDPDAAAAELHRVLRPHGGVALMWHLPGWSSEPPKWVLNLGKLLDGLRTDHPG